APVGGADAARLPLPRQGVLADDRPSSARGSDPGGRDRAAAEEPAAYATRRDRSVELLARSGRSDVPAVPRRREPHRRGRQARVRALPVRAVGPFRVDPTRLSRVPARPAPGVDDRDRVPPSLVAPRAPP